MIKLIDWEAIIAPMAERALKEREAKRKAVEANMPRSLRALIEKTEKKVRRQMRQAKAAMTVRRGK